MVRYIFCPMMADTLDYNPDDCHKCEKYSECRVEKSIQCRILEDIHISQFTERTPEDILREIEEAEDVHTPPRTNEKIYKDR